MNKLYLLIIILLFCFISLNYHFEMSFIDNTFNLIPALLQFINPFVEYRIEYPKHDYIVKGFRYMANSCIHLLNYFSNTPEELDYYFKESEHNYLKIPGPNGDIDILMVTPPNKDNKLLPLTIYFHGGGMVTGIIEDGHMRAMVKQLNTIVVGVDYRLAPENRFPKGVVDCYTVVKYLSKNSKKFNIDNKNIILTGASAGGLMTVSVTSLTLFGLPKNFPLNDRKKYFNNMNDDDIILKPPIKIHAPFVPVLEYPGGAFPSYLKFFDVGGLSATRMIWFWNMYAEHPSKCNNYLCSPTKYLTDEQYKKFPKGIVLTADADILRDEGIYYYKMLKKNNVNVYHYTTPTSHMLSGVLGIEGNYKAYKKIKELLNEK